MTRPVASRYGISGVRAQPIATGMVRIGRRWVKKERPPPFFRDYLALAAEEDRRLGKTARQDRAERSVAPPVVRED